MVHLSTCYIIWKNALHLPKWFVSADQSDCMSAGMAVWTTVQWLPSNTPLERWQAWTWPAFSLRQTALPSPPGLPWVALLLHKRAGKSGIPSNISVAQQAIDFSTKSYTPHNGEDLIWQNWLYYHLICTATKVSYSMVLPACKVSTYTAISVPIPATDASTRKHLSRVPWTWSHTEPEYDDENKLHI